ncbi:MAG: hypothetical protein QXY62_05885 [Candidatus Altiarchaeota archaeon]
MEKKPICHPEEKHYALGFCRKCYWNFKYRNDILFRERKKAINRKSQIKYIKKKTLENPEWNALKQRIYREKYPDKFNYMMCRYYFKKLSDKMRKKLFDENEKK